MRMPFIKTSVLLALIGLTASAKLAAGRPENKKAAEASPSPRPHPGPAPAAPESAAPEPEPAPAAPAPALAAPAPAVPPGPAAGPPSEAAQRGLVDFERYCASCHGRKGDGRGPSSHRFAAWATNFWTGAYKCRSTAAGVLPTDEDLRRSIVEGLSGSGMPPFRTLGPMQLEDLIATLKHFSARFGREPQGPPIVVPPESQNDQQSVVRGAEVYNRLQCANCHGSHGEGGPGAAGLHNDNGTLTEVTDFTRNESLRCGETAERLYLSFMTGLEGTPMPSLAGLFHGSDAWDLVHYVLSLRTEK
jgi:mono/diheme cytochrome c family protein